MEAWFREDGSVQHWLGCYRGGNKARLYLFWGWYRWLQGNKRFRGLKPVELVELQRSAGKKDQYVLLDLLQSYIRNVEGTYNGLAGRYSAVKSFFKKNRAALPDDDFNIEGTRPPTKEMLSVESVRSIIQSVSPRVRPAYLTVWMGILDQARFLSWNKDAKSAVSLVRHLREKGVDKPFLIEYSGRKQTKNRLYYHTYIGRDALASWQEYFERIRGWPQEGEPLLIDLEDKALTEHGLRCYHLRLLEKLRYIKRGGNDSSRRYGYNMHEFRDVARTLLRLRGKAEGLDLDVIEFFMGHITDRNRYDKFYHDREYTLTHYLKAEKYLNIVSGTSGVDLEKTQEKMRQYEILIQQMSGKFEEATRRLEEVERKLMKTEQVQTIEDARA